MREEKEGDRREIKCVCESERESEREWDWSEGRRKRERGRERSREREREAEREREKAKDTYSLCVVIELVANVCKLFVSRKVPKVSLDDLSLETNRLDAKVDPDGRNVTRYELIERERERD